jgi:hypothetical protein
MIVDTVGCVDVFIVGIDNGNVADDDEDDDEDDDVFCIYEVTTLDDTFLGNIEHF